MRFKRNTFYKRKAIVTANAFPLDYRFKDIATKTNTDKGNEFTLGLIEDGNAYLMKSNVVDTPAYGNSSLIGGYLQLYNKDQTTLNNRNVPQLLGFRLDPYVDVAQGNSFLATASGAVLGSNTGVTVGDKITTINSKPVSALPMIEENFEGRNELGGVSRMGNNSVVNGTQPYVPHYALKQWFIDNDVYTNENTFNEFCAFLDTYDPGQYKIEFVPTDTVNKPIIKLIKFGTTSKRKISKAVATGILVGDLLGLDRVADLLWDSSKGPGGGDKMGALRSYYSYEFSYTEWFQRNMVMFKDLSSAGPELDSSPNANPRNTIFDDIMSTRVDSNFYDGSDTNPVLSSTIELSTERSLNDGQSLRFYHNWGYSNLNFPTALGASIQDAIGNAGQINPQVHRASIYNIPMPTLPFDAGKSSITMDESTINILSDMQSVIPEISMDMSIEKLGGNLPLNVSGGSLVSGARSHYNSADMAKTEFSTAENTFLRSIVVTFSNYKPKPEHTTVDKFLNYGLSRFYSGKDDENIVGGVVFTTFTHSRQDRADMGDGAYKSVDDCYAFPLPVTEMKSIAAANTRGKTLLSGGISQIIGNSAAQFPDADTCIWGVTPTVSGTATGFDSLVDSPQYLRFAKVPMNSWFTMRNFFDIQQQNNSGSTAKNPYSTQNGETVMTNVEDRGVPMRVIFDTHNGPDASGSIVQNNVRNKQFVDVFFPIGDADQTEGTHFPTGGADYNFNDRPDWFPKHMTIWVQNYCWADGAVDGSRLSYSGDNVIFQSGSVMESEVYVDNIRFKNFGPAIDNFTGLNPNARCVFNTSTHFSPITTLVSGTNTSSATPKYFKRSWVQSYPAVSGTTAVLSGTCQLTSGSSTVKILSASGTFDTSFLENMAEKTSGTFGGGTVNEFLAVAGEGIAANTFVKITGPDEFTMSTAADGAVNAAPTSKTVYNATLEFSSFGTLNPKTNVANLYEYSVGQNICIGLDEKFYLPIASTNYNTEAAGYLLWNDFSTASYNRLKDNPIFPQKIDHVALNNVGGFISVDTGHDDSVALKLGGQMYAEPYVVSGTTTGNALSGARYQITSGTSVGTVTNQMKIVYGSTDKVPTDGFRQKGHIYWNMDNSGGVPSLNDWVKRENILTSTKVIAVPDTDETLNANQLRVDQPFTFNRNNPDETYTLYIMGATTANSFRKTGLKLDTELPIVGNKISFTSDVTTASDNFTLLGVEGNLNRLWIGPEKYWATMCFDTPSSVIPRSYENVCMIQQTPTLATCSGSTWNEWTFSMNNAVAATGGRAGIYQRPWDLMPDLGNATYVLNTDFGEGPRVLDEETNTESGGSFIKGPVYLNNYNKYRLQDVVKANQIQPGAEIMINLFIDSESTTNENIVFSNEDTSTRAKKPAFYWEFFDAPPVVKDFTVNPAFNLDEVDLYSLGSENLSSVKFNWQEENADDAWYRLLFVDDEPIRDKYHNAIMWLPLNESVTDLNTAPTYTVYNPSAGTSGSVTVGSSVRTDIDGQSGYAPIFVNNSNGTLTVPNGTNSTFEDLTEFTLVLHATFATADAGSRAGLIKYINAASDTATNNFILEKNTSDKIVCQLGSGVDITGTTTVTCDGEVPTSIIVTFNSGSADTIKAKLFVDGTLVGTSTGTTIATNTNGLHIGGIYAASRPVMQGRMEEIVLYNKEYKVVNSANSYTYNTQNILDIVGGENVSQNARLFVADYHNFRGNSPQEIGMSNQVSWRATTV
tara:strand:+ start:38 stop:5218 length:5181 start_codon:yes stop_codon:yes gene_type:complete